MGTYSKEDASKLASSLIREKQEFQGRIFRTTTGKLYAGYFYNFKDAKIMLKKLKKFQDGTFSDASIKNIQF
jgi:nitrous oxidase accessory protein NosD